VVALENVWLNLLAEVGQWKNVKEGRTREGRGQT